MKRLPIDASAKWSGTRSGVSITRVSSVAIAADTIHSSRAKVLSFPMALTPERVPKLLTALHGAKQPVDLQDWAHPEVRNLRLFRRGESLSRLRDSHRWHESEEAGDPPKTF